jgi:hypothetical protein
MEITQLPSAGDRANESTCNFRLPGAGRWNLGDLTLCVPTPPPPPRPTHYLSLSPSHAGQICHHCPPAHVLAAFPRVADASWVTTTLLGHRQPPSHVSIKLMPTPVVSSPARPPAALAPVVSSPARPPGARRLLARAIMLSPIVSSPTAPVIVRPSSCLSPLSTAAASGGTHQCQPHPDHC